jgi:hypothetical protein
MGTKLLEIETKRGPVELPMLVGDLLRAATLMTINDRRQRKCGQFLPADYNGPRLASPPDK